MESEMLAAVGPLLWIAISYIDPGKWTTAVEGGSLLGLDMFLVMFVLNFIAILCQYLSASVAIATGRNLAQICSEAYDDLVCLLLGIQVEISMIVLDFTMVLGTACGLNGLFGINSVISCCLTGYGVVLFPLFASFLEYPKAMILSILLTSFLLSFYVAGFPVSEPKSSVSVSRMLSKLTGGNSYVLMGVLGANIMPHNFYLHSSIVQQGQGHPNVSAGDLCRYHFLATLFIFNGIFMVNFMLTYFGANVFYGSEFISLTLEDALSLSYQGFKSSLASTALIFIMFFSNQLVAVSWSNGIFLEIGRLHRSTIKLIVMIPAFYCYLHSEAEEIFKLLIFTQVVVGLLLPSSVIPLFRIASSKSIMGACRISRRVELLTIFSCTGMLVLNVMFFSELAIGISEWVFFPIKWSNWSAVPIVYRILLITSLASICFTFYLVITPLKHYYHLETWTENQEEVSPLQSHQSSPTPTSDLNFPETALLDSEINPHPTMAQENSRNLRWENDDAGSGEGSLLRLLGLGHASRCQLTTILDEFWGQLFDYHGQPTRDGAMKLNDLLGVESSPVKSKRSSPWDAAGLGFKENSPLTVCRDAFALQLGPGSGESSFWTKQPHEHFGVGEDAHPKTLETASVEDMETKVLKSFRSFIMELLKLDGLGRLFRQDDGVDEDIIARVATRERFLIEAESRTMDRNQCCAIKIDGSDHSTVMHVPHCGDACVWRVGLIIVSFGVWGLRRILQLSLSESRHELWEKYTYVLNRLQGIIDLAFSKPRRSMATPCICLDFPDRYLQKPGSEGGRGKVTSPAMLVELIKNVKVAVSRRKSRSDTVAGDVAFLRHKKNLCSVLRRYKSRLSRLQ